MRAAAALTVPWRPVAVGAWAAAVAALVVTRGIPLERAQVLAVCISGLLAASVGAPGRLWSVVRDWVPIGLALTAYDLLRGLGDEVGRPVQVALPARVDDAVFGAVPSVWLQRRLGVDVAWWHVVAALLYASHFVVPFAAAAWVWWRAPARWYRWRRRFLTVTVIALATFLLLPVAPPWVASRLGEIGDVRRSAADGWSALGLDAAADVISFGQATTNLYAALPSLHTAYAVLTAVTVAPLLSRGAAIAMWTYPVALGFTLVATGEHYVVDVVAGAALVGGVCWWWRRAERDDETPAVAVAPAPGSAPRWLGPVLVPAVLALCIRLPRLDRPRVLVYDEAFYVNDALDLALTGRQPAAFHPPLAKLVIAPFVGVAGFEPIWWRLPMLLCGVGVVVATSAAAWLATADRRSTALAGLLVATDGLLVVTSRVALLDGVAALCVALVAMGVAGTLRAGGRCWPVVTVLAAGAGMAAKWSTAPAAVGGLAVAVWAARRAGWGWLKATATVVVTFVAASTVAWGPVVLRLREPPLVVAAARMFHESWAMLRYHADLPRTGGGHVSGWQWFTQGGTTTMYELSCDADVVDGVCRPGGASRARIVAAGNPVLWLAGTAAMLAIVLTRRTAAGLVIVAMAAGCWLPWLLPSSRPYAFYGAVVSPLLAVGVAAALAGHRRRVELSIAIGALAMVWLAVAYAKLTAIT